MNISKKWQAAAAGAIALALVGGGASAANAAPGDPINPQPEGSAAAGSKGGFFLFDGNTGEPADSDGTRSYAKDETIIGSASATNVDAEINAAATRPVTGATTFTGVYAFISEKNSTDLMGGINTWNAYHVDAAAGPNGGTLQPSLTLESFVDGPGGIADDIAAGGTYWYGIAYTNLNGVQVAGAVYREITIEPGTGNYTVTPSVLEGAAPVDVIEEAELVGAELGSAEPAVDTTVVPIAGGTANANKTLNVGVYAAGARIDLGTVTLDADGNGSVDVAGEGLAANAAHKLFLYELDGEGDEILVGWDAFTLTATLPPNQDTTDLSVEVTNSGKFALVAPAAQSIDLGDVRRNRVSAPVDLGAVTVFDDRDVLSGWNLNITSSAFTGPGATTVEASALGYAPVGTTLFPGITAGAPKLAGEGTFGVLAEGAPGSATGEFEGAVVDTELTFKAPINAAKGVHNAVLTLDLVSK
ncbi:hypothetical protein HF576_12640 [Microbacterium sp. CFH 90308]|uniref:WxL domain-containing protein n=1 Tax=Microbacterium salsuginis TaxID=2722803 RepID=A0ABX1KE98_9MICO|nr:hypothetical protein [Microbacterium sp. CFH 90308]NLP84700.1 hypothetical protein [Microbacterium sp. CFH 90308]